MTDRPDVLAFRAYLYSTDNGNKKGVVYALDKAGAIRAAAIFAKWPEDRMIAVPARVARS